MEYQDRLRGLRERLEVPLLVSRLPNLRYLTGFTGSNGYLLVRDEGATLVTDGRYGEMAERLVEHLPGTDVVIYTGRLMAALEPVLGGLSTVVLEGHWVTWDFARRLSDTLGAELVPSRGGVESLRMEKDDGEVERLRRAAAACDAAFSALDELIEESRTERELAWALIEVMRDNDGDLADWGPIVAVGANASLPHHRPGDDPVGGGLLLLDYGCVVDGYHSDMSRTVWLGAAADPEIERVHRAVGEAQREAIAAIEVGVTCKEVDEAARRVLRGYDYEQRFVHSTGHGVGLEIHEAPSLRATSDETLEAGHVVTVEPGVYLPGTGGVRIEDVVLVTEAGPELLTRSPRGLVPT
ncbi:MAG: M24 family metallopeptidase [Acidimicrobiia bacterium]